ATPQMLVLPASRVPQEYAQDDKSTNHDSCDGRVCSGLRADLRVLRAVWRITRTVLRRILLSHAASASSGVDTIFAPCASVDRCLRRGWDCSRVADRGVSS